MNMVGSPGLHDAWNQKEHESYYAGWDRYSNARLVRLCDQFNDCQLFRTLVRDQSCQSLSDVGCANGPFYRFFRKVWPSLEYKGFDISGVAIEKAKSHYPTGNFTVFDGCLKSLPGIKSDIVFCRDVVQHQPSPYEFLSDLYDITRHYLILRILTREVRATVINVSQSCQYHYGRWVPYIVVNTSELLDLVRSFKPTPAKITLRRYPVVLGGQNSRFLPKELYYPETGTAETALLIEREAREESGNTQVTIETRPEARNMDRAFYARWLIKLARRSGL